MSVTLQCMFYCHCLNICRNNGLWARCVVQQSPFQPSVPDFLSHFILVRKTQWIDVQKLLPLQVDVNYCPVILAFMVRLKYNVNFTNLVVRSLKYNIVATGHPCSRNCTDVGAYLQMTKAVWNPSPNISRLLYL